MTAYLKKLWFTVLSLAGMVIAWAILILGTLQNTAWAWNLYAFMTWVGLIMMFVICLGRSTAKMKGEAFDFFPKTFLPEWFRNLENLAGAMFLAAVGHWFYGILMFIYLAVEAAAREPLAATTPEQVVQQE